VQVGNVASAGSGTLHRSAWRKYIARTGGILASALLGSLVVAATVNAQVPATPPAPAYSPAQLDQMLAPIALYPDELLGQILTAATYPLEVVQADRWLQDAANASMQGDQLAQAMARTPWDPSVRALVAFPQILRLMDTQLEWTEQLGDAFIAQQPDVMDSVQRLRARAQAAGTLVSAPQEVVTNAGQGIEIAPPDGGQVYVPVYNPMLAYGYWPDPDYPPYDFYLPGYAVGAFIGFAIVAPLWGWHHWDWRHHDLDIDGGPRAPLGQGRVPERPVPWRHDPGHRRGVPYRQPETQARFEGRASSAPPPARNPYRGYPPAENRQAPARKPSVHASPGVASTDRAPGRAPASSSPAPVQQQVPARPPAPPRPPAPVFEHAPVRPAAPVIERAPPPALESFGRGAQVKSHEERGATSRTSTPAPSTGARGHR